VINTPSLLREFFLYENHLSLVAFENFLISHIQLCAKTMRARIQSAADIDYSGRVVKNCLGKNLIVVLCPSEQQIVKWLRCT
jgi:hypothetical protein